MRFYLLRTDGSVSDAGDYPAKPADRPDGTWTAGAPPSEAPVPKSRIERLSTIFDAQPVDLRAQFAPLRAAVKTELELGHVTVARRVIELALIPAELESVRVQLLAEFD